MTLCFLGAVYKYTYLLTFLLLGASYTLTYLLNLLVFTDADRHEFCQFDKFEGNCERDEVIIMDSAQYGRMTAGRCISGEGYIGCSADVRVYLDGRCSGRRQCSISVASLTDIVQPCRRDFTSYLEASYTCMKGESHLQYVPEPDVTSSSQRITFYMSLSIVLSVLSYLSNG